MIAYSVCCPIPITTMQVSSAACSYPHSMPGFSMCRLASSKAKHFQTKLHISQVTAPHAVQASDQPNFFVHSSLLVTIIPGLLSCSLLFS